MTRWRPLRRATGYRGRDAPRPAESNSSRLSRKLIAGSHRLFARQFRFQDLTPQILSKSTRSGGRRAAAEAQHSLCRRYEDAVAAAPRKEFHVQIHLPAVGLEA